MPRTIADLMAETLSVAGVQRIYGVVGDSLNGFTDSLRKQKKIDWIHMRHEEAAAFAACRPKGGNRCPARFNARIILFSAALLPSSQG